MNKQAVISKTGAFLITLILVINSISCLGQGNNQHFVWTGWEKYNLKGKVKQFNVSFERFYPYESVNPSTRYQTEEFKTQQLYEVRNYFRRNQIPMGRVRFDTLGLELFHFPITRDSLVYNHIISVKLASHSEVFFEYNMESVLEKMDIEGIYHPFPVHSPYRVKPSAYILSLTIDSTVSALDAAHTSLHTYELDSLKRTVSEVHSMRFDLNNYYSGERDENLLRNDSVNERIIIRRVNSFDSKHRIIRQDVIFREQLEPEYRLFAKGSLHVRSGLESGINNQVYYSFSYDDEDRITKASITENDKIIWEEEYEYVSSSRRPVKLTRFIKHERTSIATYFSDYSTEWFNDKGDIIKSENYNGRKELVRTCFYEYQYDEVGNWTRCDMYLEGGDQKTEKPTIRVHREINYFE